MEENIDLDKLVADREAFNKFVYTPWEEAVKELKRRWNDKELEKKVCDYLKCVIPEPLSHSFKLVLFRQLFTPNYEFLRFRAVADALEIEPLFWEYHDDKFTSNNPMKHALGKMHINRGVNKNNGIRVENKNIIDFNKSNGKKIKEVKTIWGQSLIDFHHELLDIFSPNTTQYLFDASEWFHINQSSAKNYYKSYMTLFVRNAILFENFLLEGNELEFTKSVFLPLFIQVWKQTGIKPLIVSLAPTHIEGDIFWISYPQDTLKYIE